MNHLNELNLRSKNNWGSLVVRNGRLTRNTNSTMAITKSEPRTTMAFSADGCFRTPVVSLDSLFGRAI